jgi:hypothetical protein
MIWCLDHMTEKRVCSDSFLSSYLCSKYFKRCIVLKPRTWRGSQNDHDTIAEQQNMIFLKEKLTCAQQSACFSTNFEKHVHKKPIMFSSENEVLRFHGQLILRTLTKAVPCHFLHQYGCESTVDTTCETESWWSAWRSVSKAELVRKPAILQLCFFQFYLYGRRNGVICQQNVHHQGSQWQHLSRCLLCPPSMHQT